jgi:hypothetical protein
MYVSKYEDADKKVVDIWGTCSYVNIMNYTRGYFNKTPVWTWVNWIHTSLKKKLTPYQVVNLDNGLFEMLFRKWWRH